MDPVLAIVILIVVALTVVVLNLPGIVIGATIVLLLIGVLLPHLRTRP